FGGEDEVREDAEGREADGDAVAHLERGRARFGLRACDEDGDAEALLRRVDCHLVERRFALGGLARDEVEPYGQTLVRADEVLLLYDAVGQTSAAFGERARQAQAHVFGPEDELDRLPVAEARDLPARLNRSRAQLDARADRDAKERVRRAETSRNV